jgi:hypothetical protein
MFRMLLLLYPFWFRDRFGAEMLAEFDAARARGRTRRETGKFWLAIRWDSLETIPRIPVAHDPTGRRAALRATATGSAPFSVAELVFTEGGVVA